MALIDDEKDKKAFEKLYNKYKNKVHAISLNILKMNNLLRNQLLTLFYRWLNVFKKLNI